MKKWLLLILRLGVAAAGIAYIVYSINWVDHVELMRNGEKLSCPVVEGYVPPTGAPVDVVILLPAEADGAAQRQAVTAAQLADPSSGYIGKPGVVTMLRYARFGLLVAGLVLISVSFPIQTWRWGVLMRARGMEADTWKRFRLVMVGSFFNFCMPGTTGGDVVKAWYVAKRSDRRADAVMTVVVDRVTGLLGLIILAGLAGLLILDHEVGRVVTMWIWLGVVAGCLGACVYFSSRLRRWTGMSWLLRRLPAQQLLRTIDEAAVAYRNHMGAVGVAIAMSVVNHFAIAVSLTLAGYALGMKVSFAMMATVIPVLLLAGSVPVTYQGLGVMEWLGEKLLVSPPDVYFIQVVGVLMMFRLYNIFYSLFGALFLLRGDIHLHPEREEISDCQPAT